jgi:signal peptidase I
MKRAGTKKNRSGFREYFELIAETAVFVLFINTFVAQASQVPTASMENTLLVGDFLFINRMAYAKPVLPLEKIILPGKTPEKGDIVTFKFLPQGGQELVKRVIATAGDTVAIVDKRVLVNGKPLPEGPAIHNDNAIIPGNEATYGEFSKRDNFGPITVPAGSLFVMGDNRDISYDSRFWGCLPLSAVRGRPWILFFSYRAEANVHLKQGLRDKLRRWTQYFPKARWGRLLHTVH